MEEQFAELARRLAARGVPVTVALARPPVPSVRALLEGAGACIETLAYQDPVAASAGMARLIARQRPAVAHFHFIRPTSPVVLVARAMGARVLVSDHLALVDGRSGLVRRCKRGVHRVLGQVVERRVAVSHYVAGTVVGAEAVPAARMRVIENGVNLERFRPPADRSAADLRKAGARRALGIPPKGAAIACVGRMAPEKGIDVAIRAFARLAASAPASSEAPSLIIVGDGPDRGLCEALVARLGMGERVHFLGLRDDIEEVLGACDQAWVPSRSPEAFGLVAAEAMAAGLPVIASRVGGLPEVVHHEHTGLLVPPGDDEALARAATRLLDDEAAARAMGRAGLARARAQFSIERFAERIIALYEETWPAWSLEALQVAGAAATSEAP